MGGLEATLWIIIYLFQAHNQPSDNGGGVVLGFENWEFPVAV